MSKRFRSLRRGSGSLVPAMCKIRRGCARGRQLDPAADATKRRPVSQRLGLGPLDASRRVNCPAEMLVRDYGLHTDSFLLAKTNEKLV